MSHREVLRRHLTPVNGTCNPTLVLHGEGVVREVTLAEERVRGWTGAEGLSVFSGRGVGVVRLGGAGDGVWEDGEALEVEVDESVEAECEGEGVDGGGGPGAVGDAGEAGARVGGDREGDGEGE
eukprot:CAMPEP_0184736030 /NCGR_PEP_ID=MMETSP0314-20130426/62198_1 /TAXON_ID=38298 /ORGANISM="Rhodella maculata, Strain CCMP 736" /LENGTH=123 /DNA_ID=CAMNT_0027203089 /DNA_START=205 /DNA_END=577 /DNA_ORIENTATION=+